MNEMNVILESSSGSSFLCLAADSSNVAAVCVGGRWLDLVPHTFRVSGGAVQWSGRHLTDGIDFECIEDGELVKYVLDPASISGWKFLASRI